MTSFRDDESEKEQRDKKKKCTKDRGGFSNVQKKYETNENFFVTKKLDVRIKVFERNIYEILYGECSRRSEENFK